MSFLSLLFPPRRFPLLNRILYVQFDSEHVIIRHINTAQEYRDVPYLVINTEGSIKSVGQQAIITATECGPRVRLINVFARAAILEEPLYAARLLMYFFFKLEARWITELYPLCPLLRPIVIFHPLNEYEQELSSIHKDSLRKSGYESSAQAVFIWHGQVLRDQDIIGGTFPRGEWHRPEPWWSKKTV